MSTRYMKKVYGSDVTLEKSNDDASDTEVSVTNNAKSKSFNVFDVVRRKLSFHFLPDDDSGNINNKLCPQLNQNSDKDEDTDDRQEDEDLVTNNANHKQTQNDTKHRRSKRKHKTFKSERVKSQQEHDAECNENIDEIDRSIREVNKLLGEPLPGCSNQVLEAQWVDKTTKENIFSIQRKHLNPLNELKRIFGSKTIEAGQRYNYMYIYVICG